MFDSKGDGSFHGVAVLNLNRNIIANQGGSVLCELQLNIFAVWVTEQYLSVVIFKKAFGLYKFHVPDRINYIRTDIADALVWANGMAW